MTANMVGADIEMSTDSMTVVHVSSAHPWTDNRILYRECVSLTEAGYSVTLIATESVVEGPATAVRVLRIPRRRRFSRMLISTVSAIRLALLTRARITHLHDPELIPFIPLLRLAGRTVLYDAHEDLPNQVVNKPYVKKPLVPLFMCFARLLILLSKLSHHVICATETIAKRYPAHRRTVVHNYPPLREEETVADQYAASNRDALAVYVGGIASIRGAETIVDAMAENDLPETWKLVIAGSGPDSLLADLRSRPGWRRVDFRGQLPPDDARRLLLEAQVGLVLLSDTAAHRDALPTKMFEYFAAGTPVIASDFPLWRSIIQEHSCGLLVDPTSSSQVAAAIRRYSEEPGLLDRHSRNARRLAREELNWSSEAKALVAAYQRLSGKPRDLGREVTPHA